MNHYSDTDHNPLEWLNPHIGVPIPLGLLNRMRPSTALVLGVLLLMRDCQSDNRDYVQIRQTDISDFLGLSSRTVNRCYKELREMGVISYSRKVLAVYKITVNIPRIAELISSK